MLAEHAMDRGALHADTPSVNEPDLAKAFEPRGLEILRDNVRNVARRERVEVEMAFDRNVDGIVLCHWA
jgi:hypothetical protein